MANAVGNGGRSSSSSSSSSSRRRRVCYREVLPFLLMVIVECGNVGNSTLFKAASNEGMSYMVFIVYSYGLAALSLAPLALLFHRKAELPPFNLAIMGRIFFLAASSVVAQMLGYKGIQYSSPTLSSAISNLTPAVTFALAIIFRTENLVLTSLHTWAKIMGTVISIAGALVVTLYSGPAVVRPSSDTTSLNQNLGLGSSQSNWALGGLLVTGECILVSVWYNVQAQTARLYPAEFVIVLLNDLGVALISCPIFLFLEPDRKAWNITTRMMLISLLYSGIVSSAFGIGIHTWNLRVKGPVYVASFRPLSIVIAAIMGVLFLGDTLFLGSVIGAIIIVIGFYMLLWGKAQEELNENWDVDSIESPAPEYVPLLR